MSRRMTYVVAILLLSLVGMVIFSAVHIPAQERRIQSEREVHARLVEASWLVLPPEAADLSAEVVFEEVEELPIRAEGQQLALSHQAVMHLTIVADAQSQQEMEQAALANLSSVEGDFGLLTDRGTRYLVEVDNSQASLDIRLYPLAD